MIRSVIARRVEQTEHLIDRTTECPECTALTADVERLKSRYAAAVDVFFATGYEVSDTEHRRLKNSVEEARALAEIACRKVENHRDFHAGAAVGLKPFSVA